MVDNVTGIITACVAVFAVIVAAIALKYNAKSSEYAAKSSEYAAKSFENVRKTEELAFLEAIYRDISRSLKEYNLLKAETPTDTKSPKTVEEKVRLKKLDVLLDEFFADVNWLCFLFLHDKIRDDTLVDAFKDQILDWYGLFAQERPEKVLNGKSYPDFQNFYLKYRKDNKEVIP